MSPRAMKRVRHGECGIERHRPLVLEEAYTNQMNRGVPGWRNWQTRRTQNPVLAREWEFDPPSGHQERATTRKRRRVSPEIGLTGYTT